MIDKRSKILFAIAMVVKIVYGLAILIVGSAIVIVFDWFIPTFNIYSPDSVVYIAGIFTVYCTLDLLLLSKAKPTPAIILIVVPALPFVIIYTALEHLSLSTFVESAPANIKRYAFYEPGYC